MKLDEVVRLVSYDSNIAGQCLRVAGSPLFGLPKPPESIKAAVLSSGVASGRNYVAHLLPGASFPCEKMAAGSGGILAAFAGMRHGVPKIQ